MDCPVCSRELEIRLITTHKGRKSIMVVCGADGRHFRGFINDTALLRRVIDGHLEIRKALETASTKRKWVKLDGKKPGEPKPKLTVTVRHVSLPGSSTRISRALDILFQAVGRDTSQIKESTRARKKGLSNQTADGDPLVDGARIDNDSE